MWLAHLLRDIIVGLESKHTIQIASNYTTCSLDRKKDRDDILKVHCFIFTVLFGASRKMFSLIETSRKNILLYSDFFQ